MDLSKNLFSSFFSLLIFGSNLSKASVDFGLGGQVLNLVRSELTMKLSEQVSVVLDSNLAQECTKVVKVFISDSLLFPSIGLNLSESVFLIRLLINLGKPSGLRRHLMVVVSVSIGADGDHGGKSEEVGSHLCVCEGVEVV